MNELNSSYPCLDSTAGVIPLPDGRIQVRTPSTRLTIGHEAQLARDLFGLCDGTHAFEDILASLRERGYPDARTRELCRFLARRCVLLPEAPPDCEDMLLAHAWHYSKRTDSASEVAVWNNEERIQVCGSGHLAEAVRADLARLQIPFSEAFVPSAPNLSLIVACSDYENHGVFRDRNRDAVGAGRAILFACLAEAGIRIGPLVVPRESACFECFHHRLRANLAFREEFDAFIEHNAFLDEAGIDSKAGIYARVGSGFVCTQILHFLLGTTQHCMVDKLVEVSPMTSELFSSQLLKLPRCGVCGCSDEETSPAARDWV